MFVFLLHLFLTRLLKINCCAVSTSVTILILHTVLTEDLILPSFDYFQNLSLLCSSFLSASRLSFRPLQCVDWDKWAEVYVSKILLFDPWYLMTKVGKKQAHHESWKSILSAAESSMSCLSLYHAGVVPHTQHSQTAQHCHFIITLTGVVCWFFAWCPSNMQVYLLRQVYVLPHWDRSCRSNFLSPQVTVY